MRYDNSELCDLLAAEYELGTLTGQARKRFERLLRERPELVEKVDDWRAMMNRLAGDATPVEPPADVWQSIRERIEPESAAPVSPWWQRLGVWRFLALGNGVLVAVLAVIFWLMLATPNAVYMAVIKNARNQPVWMIEATGPARQLDISNLIPVEVPEGKYCVLWARSGQSGAYYRLGALPEKGDNMTLPLTAEVREMASAQLVVSLEDKAAGPSDAPLGALEYQGRWMVLNEIPLVREKP